MNMNKKIILSIALSFAAVCGFAQQQLTLEQCLDNARKYNHDLRSAALEIEAAREQKKEAYTNYFPKIQANAMAFKVFEKLGKKNEAFSGSNTVIPDDPAQLESIKDAFAIFLGVDANIDLLAPTDVNYNSSYSTYGFDAGYLGAVTAVQPIFLGGRIINGNKLAKVGIEAAELKQVIKEKDVLQKVTECFWQLATVKYNIRTVEAAEKQISAVKTRVQDLVDAGVITANALLQVKLREQELASTRVKLENGDQLLRLLLAQQIGFTDSEIDIVLPDDVSQPQLPSFAKGASENRPELELASKGIEAEKLRVKIEKGKLLPTVGIGVAGLALGHNFSDVSGNVNGTVITPLGAKDFAKDFSMADRITKSKITGLALASISVPISDWWGGTHAVRRQKVRVAQAQEVYQDAREKLALDNKSAWLKVIEAYKQIGIAKASVEQAEENLRMHTDQYEAGTITVTDLLDAETLNRKAHDQLSSALADYQVRLADYQRKISW